ncbi:hypothetical protein LN389_12150 [Enterobacter hormaechei subsp. steigerwaltii]|uniref:hypothetical protein n=1 Tax=Enterobacter hormaechei TaxID=158836 RepID=UPI0007952FEA|nr:hypothetical protein [Enterobacter hormaechei]MCC9378649.1 hypothetical protein [Enterobacter hormaechei subsp. steigerwaltii]MCC9394505.1 hypothetical protein [Enterobacter hormaechei subsp. steigerwaltii]MCC9416541.1 hypothetical protein [Enterobacter hormaechei subsp. steigerwaltii]CZY23432.1 Uncharacterised protein [Enterobacter hormaechei]VAC61855.1 Uncharacterised protein [Enterobacter hormaechei]
MRLTIEALAISVSFLVTVVGYAYHYWFKIRKQRREKDRQEFIDRLRSKYKDKM